MQFSEKLNQYITQLSCTAKDVCNLSGISTASFSRYRNGERVPKLGTQSFESLCHALAQIAAKRKMPGITADTVKQAFVNCDDFVSTDYELLRKNFNTLLSVLNINIAQLCKYINYDASTIFRIRNGTRKPGDAEQFAAAVASFVAKKMQTSLQIADVAALIGCEADTLSDITVRYSKIQCWLLEHPILSEQKDSVSVFLNKLNAFDLNEYIKAVRFDELKVPSVPFQIPSSKTYFGLKEMMESELDFLKATALSKSTVPVTMYSDMPMKDMAIDPEFPKKWMFGMASLLKKGLHLNQIHNLDRSFDEMMLGIESWIPMYMTGQISPYYFKNAQNNVFLHLLKVSGAAALSGEAIAGYHAAGKYYLTKSKHELAYYQQQADAMLKNACPLMDIYRSEREKEFNAFLFTDMIKPGRRRNILSTLPLYTISTELLLKILTRNDIHEMQKEKIINYTEMKRKQFFTTLQNSTIADDIPQISREDFEACPFTLELSGLFYDTDVPYTFEEYALHLSETKHFSEQYINYIVRETQTNAFRNLQITICEGQWVMVSKGKSPAIHFLIHHTKLRDAIEKFVPPIWENI